MKDVKIDTHIEPKFWNLDLLTPSERKKYGGRLSESAYTVSELPAIVNERLTRLRSAYRDAIFAYKHGEPFVVVAQLTPEQAEKNRKRI